jgi:hypothetical protein
VLQYSFARTQSKEQIDQIARSIGLVSAWRHRLPALFFASVSGGKNPVPNSNRAPSSWRPQLCLAISILIASEWP